jgi:REP element-mobilizing transposase RayT
MPDHLHLLLEGRFTTSDFRSTMTLLRQRTAIAFHKYHRLTPWQHGYYERVLRADEETEIVAGYIVANPVRAGLVNRIEDYPFSFCWQPVRFESG